MSSQYTLTTRITINSQHCGGHPCIRGLRIRVKDILEMLATGMSTQGFYREGSQVSHIYTQPGQYKVKLRVQDNLGLASCREGWNEITMTVKDTR